MNPRQLVKSNQTALDRFCKALKTRKSFLLASHVNPEGDSAACLIAMDSLLRRLGKKSLIVCQDPFPERIGVLSSKRWNRAHDLKPDQKFDALLAADCPTLDRIGEVRNFIEPGMSIFNIDHHYTNDRFGDYNYIQTQAGACGEVVYEVFNHMGISINKEEATALYVAITTDTNSFKYSSTTSRTHLIVADLISKGVDVEKVNENLYATYSLHKMKLYSRLLAKVKTAHRGDVAWVGMSRNDLKVTGARQEDAEGFIDFLKYIREIKFAFFINENDGAESIRVSLRSKGKFDASKVASAFGGGGHQKASGCTIRHHTLEKAAQLLLKEIGKQLNGQVNV